MILYMTIPTYDMNQNRIIEVSKLICREKRMLEQLTDTDDEVSMSKKTIIKVDSNTRKT